MSVIDYDNIRQSIEHELGIGSRGWTRIVEDALKSVKQRGDETNAPCPSIYQIKEKFGELRIYYDHAAADEFQKTQIAAAISEANRCCERCGNASRLQMIGSWATNLCCWCAHERFTSHSKKHPRFNASVLLDDPLRCQTCGYVGQIAWKASGHRCPACVSKGA